MKLQRRDSYQPRESVDHSKRWMRGAERSIVGGRISGGVPEGLLDKSVRIVWRGRVGSQESICWSRLVSEFYTNVHICINL
jgi:hypothetical protein